MIGERKARLGVALLCLGLSAAAVLPFFLMSQPLPGRSRWDLRMPDTHDMSLHFDQMKSFYNGLAAGEVYPRWEEDTNFGFGAPTTSFYPPGIYYLTSAFYLVTRDWMRALLGAHLLLMLASAMAIYFCARALMSRGAAAAAMAAYIVLPYHLIDQYQRGAIAELLAYIWMPLMLLFTEPLLGEASAREEKTKAASRDLTEHSGWMGQTPRVLLSLAGLAASYGAFLWSHPPTAYQCTLAFGVFVLTFAMMQRDWKGLLLVGGAMLMGLALSAAYLYPAVREQDFIRHEIIAEIWPYHQTYLFTRAEYTQENPQFFDLLDATWSFNTVGLILCAMSLLALKSRSEGFTTRLRARVVQWVVLGGFTSFMMLPASAPVGRWIPKIDIGVFSWRMLSITTLVVSLLAGAAAQAAIDAWHEQQRAKLAALASLAALVVVGGMVFSALRVVVPAQAVEAFQPEPTHLNYAIIPRTAPANTDDLPEVERAKLSEESGQITIEQWQPEHRVLRVKTPEADQLFVRTFNYPGWTATVDGQAAKITTGEELGDIVLDIPAGSHFVTLDYLDTPTRRTGNQITTISFFLMIGMALVGLAGRAYRPGPR